MGSPYDLKVAVLHNIIIPALSEEAIRRKAEKEHVDLPPTYEGVKKLYNAIVNQLYSEIETYLKSEEAEKICERAKQFDPRASFCNDITLSLDKRLETLFGANVFQPPEQKPSPLAFWRWSLFA